HGQEALDILKTQTFDLMFMDMQMPVMDGIKATQLIRQRGDQTPIIALTANAFDTDKATCKKAGMNGFLTKPIKRGVIQQLISQYLKDQCSIPRTRLLLAEDDELCAVVMKQSFSQYFPDLSIKIAANASETCSMLKSFAPHILVLNVDIDEMNGVDGVDVLKHVKDHDKYHKLKVLINSKDSSDYSKLQEALAFDIHGNIATNYDPQRIIDTLKETGLL
ncbi:MAG: response regulator, partial [Lentisphaeraceae bacterium]|nr:response regulator [Lentisphaeraceae bacterium]